MTRRIVQTYLFLLSLASLPSGATSQPDSAVFVDSSLQPFIEINSTTISPSPKSPINYKLTPNAVEFSQKNGSYMDFGSCPLNLQSKGFSVSAVFEFFDTIGYQDIIFDFRAPNYEFVTLMRIDNSNKLVFKLSLAQVMYDIPFPGLFDQGSIYRIGITMDPRTMSASFFINGVLVDSIDLRMTLKDLFPSQTFIAKVLPNPSDYPACNIKVYSLKFYNGVLSPEGQYQDSLIRPLCNPRTSWNGTVCVPFKIPFLQVNGSGVSPPASAHDTVGSSPTFQNDFVVFQRGTATGWLYTTGQFLDFGAQTLYLGSRGFSVTVIFEFTGDSPGSFERIFDFGSGAGVDNVILTRNYNFDQVFFHISGASGSLSYCTFPVSIKQGTIHRFGVTLDPSVGSNGQVSLYQNGYLVFTAEPAAKPQDRTVSNAYVGRSLWDGEDYANMRIHSLNMYHGVLSPAQVFEDTWCKPGFTWNGTDCVACLNGTYKALSGMQSCTKCDIFGACNTTAVTSCQPGYSWNGTRCNPCDSGTYKSMSGLQERCDTCPTGSSCNATAITSCKPGYGWNGVQCVGCESGTFKTLDGFQSCDSCPVGSICEPMAIISCQPGYTRSDTKCVPCSLEFFKPEAGLGACYPCPFNSICNSTSITGCIPGTFWAGLSCEPCLEGFDKTSDDFGPCNAMTIVSSMQIFDNTTAPSSTLVDKTTVDMGTTTTTDMNPVLYQTDSKPYLTLSLTDGSSTAEYTETPTYSGSTNDNPASTTGELAPTTTDESGPGSTSAFILNGPMMPIAIGVASLALICGVGMEVYRLRTRFRTRKDGGWLANMMRLKSDAGVMYNTALNGTTVFSSASTILNGTNSTSVLSNGTTLVSPTASGKTDQSGLSQSVCVSHSFQSSTFLVSRKSTRENTLYDEFVWVVVEWLISGSVNSGTLI